MTVTNATPTISSDHTTITVNEGATANNGGSFSDPGADVVTLTASVGSVVDDGDGNLVVVARHSGRSYRLANSYDYSTDSDAAASSTMFDLTVNNVAPAISLSSTSVIVTEGLTATNSGSFADVPADTVTLSASVGSVTKHEDGTWSWTFDTTDGTDQSQTVTITALDKDGDTSSTSFGLTVNNVAPSAVDKPLEALGNVPITLPIADLLIGATDPGDDVISFKSIDDSELAGTLTIDSEASTFSM